MSENENLDLDEMTLEELKNRIPAKELANVERLVLKKWIDAPLSDNDVFINFCNNKNMCRALIHIFLQNFGVKVDNPNITYEKSANIDFDSKEVRFDLYVEDDYIIVDMEMQVVIKLMSPERIRSYQAVIDVEQIKKSEKYDSLKDTYIIIICLDDPFGYEIPGYRIKKSPVPLDLEEFGTDKFDINDYIEDDFDNSIFKDMEEFDPNMLNEYLKKMKRKHKKALCTEYVDGANILFFNASLFYKVKNKELRTFLAFVMGFHIKDCEFYHVIKERFDTTKINEKAKLSFMTSYYRELDKQTLMRERLTEELTPKIEQKLTPKIEQKLTPKIEQKLTKEIIINLISSGYNDETMHDATKLPMEEIAEFRAKYESEVEFYD